MREFLKSKAFLVPLAVGAVIALAVCLLDRKADAGIAYILSNGFFVAGVLVMGFGGLTYVRNEGMFDIFSFGVSRLFTVRWPGLSPMSEEHRKEKYVDYKVRKQKERKTSPKGLLAAGGLYFILAVLMLVIYFCVE